MEEKNWISRKLKEQNQEIKDKEAEFRSQLAAHEEVSRQYRFSSKNEKSKANIISSKGKFLDTLITTEKVTYNMNECKLAESIARKIASKLDYRRVS